MRGRLTTLALGAAFGFAISWGQFTDPDRIRAMLRLEDLYLYLMMATAVAVGFAGTRLLRRAGARTLLTGEPVAWSVAAPGRRHVAGGVLFGLGWALTDACPAPILAQVAQGSAWGLCTLGGVVAGIWLYLRRQEQRPAPALARQRRWPATSQVQSSTTLPSGSST